MLTSRLRRSRSADGYAMLTVLFAVLVMTVVATSALALASKRQVFARAQQDSQGALQAAQAGLDDYVARLQDDTNYWTKGNTDSGNPALSGYTPVPGSTSGATFKYTVNNSTTLTNGEVTVTATGKVAGKTRTLTGVLGKQDFLDKMYFTQYETSDPVTYASPPPAGTCDHYAYESPSPRPTPGSTGTPAYCTNISFGNTDVLRGPTYSQDRIQIAGNPKFNDTFRTGWNDPTGTFYSCPAGGCSPTFSKSKGYQFVDFPSTNAGIRPYAVPSLGGTGCLFSGPTAIVFNGPGTMTVTSPYTSSATSTGACGTHDWSTGFTVSVPSGEVIWVDATPSANASCTAMPAGFPFPIGQDTNSLGQVAKLAPSCRNGDAYVSGWVKGQVTLGAVNNIYITNHLRYVGSNSNPTAANLGTGVPTSSSTAPPTSDTNGLDVLGLAAQNFVEVYHPLNGSANPTTSPYPLTNLLIDAAIVASQDSFYVEDYKSGPVLGALSVDGAIIQKYRGPVATGNSAGVVQSGYSKNYAYDSRLGALSPPHLQTLAASTWGVVSQAEGNAQP